MTATAVPWLRDLPPRDFTARLPRRVVGVARRRHRRHSGRSALALLAAVAVPAFAAPGEWPSFRIDNAGRAEAVVEPMPFEKAGDSFPGSAFYYLAADDAAPALDSQSRSDAAGAPTAVDPYAGPAARALHAGGSMVDRMQALTCLTQAIYYEAASEPDSGQRAVAQVVLNRVSHPAYPKTVCGVVYQGTERGTGCQFSFTCDGALDRAPMRLFWQRAESVARSALAGYVYAPVGLATHYHTIAVHPGWADKLNYLLTIGAHRFYRLGGPAGSPLAFTPAAYRGGEPLALPRAPRLAAPAAPDPALDPVAIERAFALSMKAAAMPAVTSGAGPAHAEPLPDTSGIRPEYRNSGKWLAQPGAQ